MVCLVFLMFAYGDVGCVSCLWSGCRGFLPVDDVNPRELSIVCMFVLERFFRGNPNVTPNVARKKP